MEISIETKMKRKKVIKEEWEMNREMKIETRVES